MGSGCFKGSPSMSTVSGSSQTLCTPSTEEPWQLAELGSHQLGTVCRPEGPRPWQSGCWCVLIHKIAPTSLNTSKQWQKTFCKEGRKGPTTPLWVCGHIQKWL